jgi:hypothetical protein
MRIGPWVKLPEPDKLAISKTYSLHLVIAASSVRLLQGIEDRG